ncbi:DUF1203 domain-containing protein [Rhizobium sp. SGZ-381]|uniref:DUF1203 domain-containing protein n=1 Tax=Rhizobium sp. SGZ-381 TaxID=3342800 RepID=UPI00366EFE23
MPNIQFTAMPTPVADTFRKGGVDAYGNVPERMISPGGGMPCRHCLDMIAEGEEMLVLAYRPFEALQPYAETGPIFLHGRDCPRYEAVEILPPMLSSPDYIVRGYGQNDRIVYGTGAVTATEAIAARADALLQRPEIAYVHIRSARNNCYQCRVDRA